MTVTNWLSCNQTQRLTTYHAYFQCWNRKMSTRLYNFTCSWGNCTSNRRSDDAIKFVPFLKAPPCRPWRRDRCLSWIKSCGRPESELNLDKVNKGRFYICSLSYFFLLKSSVDLEHLIYSLLIVIALHYPGLWVPIMHWLPFCTKQLNKRI